MASTVTATATAPDGAPTRSDAGLLAHKSVPLNRIPRYLKKSNENQVLLDKEIWMRSIWHVFASEPNYIIADTYFNNDAFNRIAPIQAHFEMFKRDQKTFYTNVKSCVNEGGTKAVLDAAVRRGITKFVNNGLPMSIGDCINNLSLALAQKVETAVRGKDLPALRTALKDAYHIQYGTHMSGDAGDAWKSKAIFTELQTKMRGKLIEAGGAGLQVSNPLSELFSKEYGAIKASVSKDLKNQGIQVLKKKPPKPRSQAGRLQGQFASFAKLDDFLIKFDFESDKGKEAWALYHSEEKDDLLTAKTLLIQAHTLLQGIDNMAAAAHSLKTILSNLDNNPTGKSALNVLCFVIILVIGTILTPLAIILLSIIFILSQVEPEMWMGVLTGMKGLNDIMLSRWERLLQRMPAVTPQPDLQQQLPQVMLSRTLVMV